MSLTGLGKILFSRFTATIVLLIIGILAWFGFAGRADWVQGWAFLLTYLIYVIALYFWFRKADPDLMRERNRPSTDAEPWDRLVVGVYSTLIVVLLIVAALDSGRFHWSRVPLLVQLTGWLLLICAGAIIWHVMSVNAYLSSWARIQEDRGQVVVKKGLYRRIRHPMYLGIILAFIGMPLALGSCWALISGLMINGLFVYRTLREDRMLAAGLPGYMAYTEEVRYRLLPGIW
jgi:protein-S-isoprenylcysteine O-methyltransferase Ste14